MRPIRIVLDEEDFTKLISGEVVDKEIVNDSRKVEIALSDIGYDRMAKALVNEMNSNG